MMQMVIVTNESLKEELLNNVSSLNAEVVWVTDFSLLHEHVEADVFIDLLFEKSHVKALKELLPKLIIINCVSDTLAETDPSFVRINGWNTFLKSSVIEASALDENKKQRAEEIFSLFNKRIEWVDDIAGFITPRVVSMIINEAFLAWQEGVSSKDEIDIAMKLGTNYPYGPFEWANKIGIKKIRSLLDKLNHEQNSKGAIITQ